MCMFGLVACDDGGPGFVNASMRTITTARQVCVRLQSKCNGTHRHAQSTPKTRSEGGTKREHGCVEPPEQQRNNCKKDMQELEMGEQRKRVEDANKICSNIHENAENKGLSLVEV